MGTYRGGLAVPGGLIWTSAPNTNTEVPTMKRFRLRLSVLLWLVAIAAAFLAGVRYGEYRAGPRPQVRPFFITNGRIPGTMRIVPAKPINSDAGP
jgi:hypothetical protein